MSEIIKKIIKAVWQRLDECPREYQANWTLDEGESIFFARELEYIKAETYDIKFPELKARVLFPTDFSTNAGAETITYEQYDQVGAAKIISNYADDLPRADVKGKEFTARVRTIADAYGYNYDEIQAAKMAGKPLVQRKAMAAKRACMILEDTIAWFGDATHNLQGFLTNPNIGSVVLPADGTGASKLWSTKTPAQIVRDMSSLPTAVHTVTKGVEVANIMLLPLAQYNYIASTKFSDSSDVTILEWFLKANPHIQEVGWANELAGAGAGATDRMVVYRRDKQALSMEIPSDFKQLPVQEKNLEYIVPCHQRFGGVLIYYPLSVCYADGL